MFNNFALQQDPTTDTLTRVSHSFIWDNGKSNVLLCVVESYLSSKLNFSMLKISSEQEIDDSLIHSFKLFELEKDVTG